MRFPASPAQRRLWFADRLAPGEPTDNLPCSFWLDGPLDADALQRAMDALVARHASLRTGIVAFDGVPEQVVANAGTVAVERVELPAELPPGERARRAEAIAGDLALRPFDLAAGPLLRAALIGAGPGRHLLTLVIHRAIGDSASVRILIDELSAYYRGETTGVPARLPALWLEYGDYAVWQQDRMRGEALQRHLAYWSEQLRGAPQLLALPAGRPRPARRSSRGEVATLDLDAAVTRKLGALADGAGASACEVFLAGFAATLSRYAGQLDLLIGVEATDRTHPELAPMMGALTNTIVLRARLDGEPTFAELVGQIRGTLRGGLAHRQLSFATLVAALAPGRTLAHAPLVQVQFCAAARTPPAIDLPGIAAQGWSPHTRTAQLDLTLCVDAGDPDAAALSLEYSADLWDREWAGLFLRCMATLLEHAANAPGTRVSDLAPASAPKLVPASAAADDEARPSPGERRDDGTPAACRAAPSGQVEAAVAKMLADLLGAAQPVGVQESLFDLGGHSLTVTRLVARIADAYGVNLPVRQVFAGPTVAELAEAISAAPGFRAAPGLPGQADLEDLSDADLDGLLRATIAQRNGRRASACEPDLPGAGTR